MEGHSPKSQPSSLRREVESPQRHDAGIGVMLIASASMFFAVASSAFILRSQMPVERCFHEPKPRPVVVAAPADEPCGEAVYQNNPDGTVSVLFDVCERDSATDSELIDIELVPLPDDSAR